MTNQHGLSRYINSEKRAFIRKRDGFGCVICGLGICTYEHFNPEFKDATEHNVDGMCLLCGQHQLKTSKGGFLSKETIAEAVTNPKCKQNGFTSEFFDLKFPIITHLGNIVMRSEGNITHDILTLGGQTMISVNKNQSNNSVEFSAVFKDKKDNISLKIDRNEWIAPIQNWDIEQVGSQLRIINEPLDCRIVLSLKPPHELIFEKIDMFYQGNKVHFDNKGMTVRNFQGELTLNINIQEQQQIKSLTIN